MIHKIVSFYGANLPPEIPAIQKRVCNMYGVNVEQHQFKNNTHNDRHSNAMEEYINAAGNWDVITFLDIDCVPTSNRCMERVLQTLSDENTLYGNAQASNVTELNPHKSPPFIGASFLNIHRKVWEKSNCKSFRFCHYPNPDGHIVEADVAEKFSRENEKQGVRLVMAYPTRIVTNSTWVYGGQFGYPKFEYGQGTEFESDTFHNFIIRVPTAQHTFISYCKNLLHEN